MQDTLKWLESKEGEAWSRERHGAVEEDFSISNRAMYELKLDHMDGCPCESRGALTYWRAPMRYDSDFLGAPVYSKRHEGSRTFGMGLHYRLNELDFDIKYI